MLQDFPVIVHTSKLSPWLGLSLLLHLSAGSALWYWQSNLPQPPRVAGQQVLSISLVDSVASMPTQAPAQTAIKKTAEKIMEEIVTTTATDALPAPRPQPIKKERIDSPAPAQKPTPPVEHAVESIHEQMASLDAVAGVPTGAPGNTDRSEASFNADYLHNPKPRYPAISMRLGEQGTVLLHVHVSVEGNPLSVELKKSSGYSRLDHAALEVVKRWQFIPAKQGQSALESWVDVPVQFSLAN